MSATPEATSQSAEPAVVYLHPAIRFLEARPLPSGSMETTRNVFEYEINQQLAGASKGKTLTFKVRVILDGPAILSCDVDFEGKAKSFEQLQAWMEAAASALKHLPEPALKLPVW